MAIAPEVRAPKKGSLPLGVATLLLLASTTVGLVRWLSDPAETAVPVSRVVPATQSDLDANAATDAILRATESGNPQLVQFVVASIKRSTGCKAVRLETAAVRVGDKTQKALEKNSRGGFMDALREQGLVPGHAKKVVDGVERHIIVAFDCGDGGG
jgi:hypothetical protein